MGTGIRMTVGALLAALLVACASDAAKAKPELAFVDLPSFDRDLYAALHEPLPRVEITFYDRITPSSIPPRLQRWLESVDSNGGKVAVIQPPSTVAAKSPLLLIGAVTSLWSAQKVAREMSENSEVKIAGNFDAQVQLKQDDRGEVIVGKVVFVQRK